MTEACCFLRGRGLVSALGPDLHAALASLAAGGVAPEPGAFPYYRIADTTPDWYQRARTLIAAALAECETHGAIDRRAPLFVASSSLNVGALEDGAAFLPDCQSFVERIAGWLAWEGPVYWVATACTSSLVALLSARRLIGGGAADSALVLGVELANRFSRAGFGALQLLAPAAARPLAADRAGLVLGEAVAALHLSRAPARWRICGGANLIDGSDPSGASRAAVARMIEQALLEAGIAAAAVDLVKLQAAGSPHNDAEEIAGLRRVFPQLPALTTLKTRLGHTLGASGAAELALLTAALDAGRWPGPTSLATDPALDIALAAGPPPRLRFLLAQILGFGGGHSGVILEDREGGR